MLNFPKFIIPWSSISLPCTGLVHGLNWKVVICLHLFLNKKCSETAKKLTIVDFIMMNLQIECVNIVKCWIYKESLLFFIPRIAGHGTKVRFRISLDTHFSLWLLYCSVDFLQISHTSKVHHEALMMN